jgi:hypothetical protein
LRFAGQFAFVLSTICSWGFPCPLYGQTSETESDKSKPQNQSSFELKQVKISGKELATTGVMGDGTKAVQVTFRYAMNVEPDDEPSSVSLALDSAAPAKYYLNDDRLSVTPVSKPLVLPAGGWGHGSTEEGVVVDPSAGKHWLRITAEMALHRLRLSPLPVYRLNFVFCPFLKRENPRRPLNCDDVRVVIHYPQRWVARLDQRNWKNEGDHYLLDYSNDSTPGVDAVFGPSFIRDNEGLFVLLDLLLIASVLFLVVQVLIPLSLKELDRLASRWSEWTGYLVKSIFWLGVVVLWVFVNYVGAAIFGDVRFARHTTEVYTATVVFSISTAIGVVGISWLIDSARSFTIS